MLTNSLRTLSCVSAAALLSFGVFGTADAGTRSYSNVQGHSAHTGAAVPENVTLPFSKSMPIHLDTDLSDVIVSNPDIVDAVVHTNRRVVLIGKKPGQTNIYFYGRNGQELKNMQIRVERDIDGLRSLISQHAPDANVEVQAVNDNLLLSGSVANAAMSQRIVNIAELWLSEDTGGANEEPKVVNLMTILGKDQVMLKVRIVEMQRTVTKQLGFDLNAIGQLGSSTVSLFSNAVGAVGGAGFSGAVDWTNSSGGDLTSLGGSIAALERVGLIRTLAEPTLTAISGETANFLSGGEFPFLTDVFVDQSGRVQREFEFKPYGVALGFTPVVLSEGRISLNISTEVSEPTTEGSFETGGVTSDILGLRIRRANTVVELPAGGSLVIAGLIREETRASSDGMPGVKNIPGVGALFRSRDDINSQTELVVIVTPYLVDPTHPDKLSTPLDTFKPANDSDAILMGRLNKVYNEPNLGGDDKAPLGRFGHVVD